MNSVEHALNTLKTNSYCRWSHPVAERNAKYEQYAINRYKSINIPISHRPKFSFSKSAKVFTIGSCFAREIEHALIQDGFDVTSRPTEIFGTELFESRPGVSHYDFFNRYNTASMYQEFDFLLNDRHSDESNEELLIYKSGPGLYDDLHYTPSLVSASIEKVLERRKLVRTFLSGALMKSDVVIITLGLCECWKDTNSELFLNVISSPQMLKNYQSQLELVKLNVLKNIEYLTQIQNLLQDKKVVLTVSPVPLEVTFSGEDIIVANTDAKSSLRAAASYISDLFDNVDYFPSYELVMNSPREDAWKADGRHVQHPLVSHITKSAIASYVK